MVDLLLIDLFYLISPILIFDELNFDFHGRLEYISVFSNLITYARLDDTLSQIIELPGRVKCQSN
jgi:hypothetical protein